MLLTSSLFKYFGADPFLVWRTFDLSSNVMILDTSVYFILTCSSETVLYAIFKFAYSDHKGLLSTYDDRYNFSRCFFFEGERKK